MDAGACFSNAQRVWSLCQGCARAIYDTRPPTPAYADRVARLLFGTAAQESGLQWERQRTPRFEGSVGGFSKWQVETGSIEASLDMLRRRPALLKHATEWLFVDPNASTQWANTLPVEIILWAMRLDDNDKIGLLFSRLHYLRVPAPISESLEDQAAYWKQWYNTIAGSGTVEQYLTSWRQRCAHIVALELGAPALEDAS
jgi:hypothetical protein